MKASIHGLFHLAALVALLGAPAYGTVQIVSLTPSLVSPQLLGTSIAWTATATDSASGPLTFQFNVGLSGQSLALVQDFNVGHLKSGVWTSPPFVWVPTTAEGSYQIQVVIKDFSSGETTSQTASYTINPLVTGTTPVAVATANPLVALFGAPSCAAGSLMRVQFQPRGQGLPPSDTNYVDCNPSATMNFEIAGMYPSTTYTMFSQTVTGGKTTSGPPITFTTGPPPSNISFPPFQTNVPPGRGSGLLLFNPVTFGGESTDASVAVDLSGKLLWYYIPQPAKDIVLTRPLPNATLYTLQSGKAWDPANSHLQFLRQIDLAGNIIKETNIGVIEQELLALGATDAQPCAAIAKPAPVGSACLDGFNHDAIDTLPNGDTAALIVMEKIWPPGTQGDTSGLPVDILGDMIVVLDTNWQVVWYFESFQHAGGPPQLDINRAPVLGNTCKSGQRGCPPLGLAGTGIATKVPDWLHGNSLYYWPQDSDILWSIRNQDWIAKLDYNNGTGTGNVLWLLGPCGDFTFNNIYNDPWPWNSAQHDVGMENAGAGPLTIFDNGDTRVSAPRKSTACMPGLGMGDSRGMALTVDESTMQVTPVLSVDLGVYSSSSGSAQLLPNGNYFFLAAQVKGRSYSIEILPTPGTDTGTQVLNLESVSGYRAWRMPDLYHPPIT